MLTKRIAAAIGTAIILGISWAAADEPLSPPAAIVTERPAPPPILIESDFASEPNLDPEFGWFGGLDSEVLRPHLKYRLSSLMVFPGLGTDVINLPATSLDWIVAPRVEVGYRLPDGMGGFVASFRPLSSRGDATLVGFGATGAGPLHTRLDLEVLDLDWASKEWVIADCSRIQWRLGARLAAFYADSLAADALVSQRSSNGFYGIGPHVGLDLWQQLPWLGTGLFVRAEAAALGGEIRQAFEELVAVPGGGVGAANDFRHTNSIPVISLQAGLSWSSGIFAPESVTYSAGYAYEHWWELGNLTGNLTGNKLSLWSQGFFIRGEWRY